ncbi:MAG: hypothetical protein HN352_18135 [Bacteroidetes bacterium]|jgi:hypothetical protein|nr:hypothetical protein [Bacteroidota bacterium]MBT4399357.1 hypothetical protein [Bacteroidota bacterium]
MKIEVSHGELLDKLSILKIKSENLTNKIQLANVLKEFDLLLMVAKDLLEQCKEQYIQLIEVNGKLWKIEDHIRNLESRKDFGQDFIETARQVYHFNDERASIKRDINRISGSDLTEEKSYQSY